MYCEKCGKELIKGSKFCKFCGAPIQEAMHYRESRQEVPMWKRKWAILGLIIALIGGFFIGNWSQASYSIEIERKWKEGADEILEKMTTMIEKDEIIIKNSETIKSKISESYECILDYDYKCAQKATDEVIRLEGQQDVLYQETNKLLEEIKKIFEEQEQLETEMRII